MTYADTMPAATPSRAARRASRRHQVQHLITADEHSLTELETALAALPLCAVGRVFIEVPDAGDVAAVMAPPRMTVTWLPRSGRSGAPGTGRRCAPGEALSRAATAWADEMLCEADASRTKVTLLGGYLGTADIVDHLTSVCGIEVADIDMPAGYGLLAR